MKLTRKQQLYDGDTFRTNWQTHFVIIECCDCHLVHSLNQDVEGKFIVTTIHRLAKETAAARRKQKRK